jgi:hypothetical protein
VGNTQTSYLKGSGVIRSIQYPYPAGARTHTWRIKVRDGVNPEVIRTLVVNVLEQGSGALPQIDLSQLDGKTFRLDEDIRFEYPDTQLIWEFQPRGEAAMRGAGSLARAPAPYAASTTKPFMNPKAGGMEAGPYTLKVTVRATNRSDSADITLVADLAQITVRPNPWKSGRTSQNGITFGNLPQGATLKIFTVSGRLVREYARVSGTQEWDLKTDKGDRAASGIYIYVITDGQGGKRTGKVGVVR